MLVSAVPQQKSDYWNSYYASRAVLKLSAPSQFAAFVAQEAGDAHLIIEVGCGNGRDSLRELARAEQHDGQGDPHRRSRCILGLLRAIRSRLRWRSH